MVIGEKISDKENEKGRRQKKTMRNTSSDNVRREVDPSSFKNDGLIGKETNKFSGMYLHKS